MRKIIGIISILLLSQCVYAAYDPCSHLLVKIDNQADTLATMSLQHGDPADTSFGSLYARGLQAIATGKNTVWDFEQSWYHGPVGEITYEWKDLIEPAKKHKCTIHFAQNRCGWFTNPLNRSTVSGECFIFSVRATHEQPGEVDVELVNRDR